MMKMTLFSWGYYGWGNATKQFVKAVDAVESSRGFKPPIFVDIRIRRSVRAPGFREAEFEKLLGADRHRWIKRLGNESIITKAKRMKIADPSAAADLLELAVAFYKQRRRIIFFCGCQFPRYGRSVGCHRTKVASLLINAAKEQGLSLEVTEWPGGRPTTIDLRVTPEVFGSVSKGRVTIPLPRIANLADTASLAWGTTARLSSHGETLERLVGPAIYTHGKWCLPVMDWNRAGGFLIDNAKQAAADARRYYGFEPCLSR